MIKNKQVFFLRKRFFLATFLIVISCFWVFWYPGVKVATDYHLASDNGILSILPWSWRQFSVADGMGEYTTFTLWSQPLLSLSELMNLASISGEVQTKLMGAAIIFFGLFGIWKLLDYFKINNWGKSVGSVFFILNSFFLLMFDGGQFSLCLAYITLPPAILSFMNLMESFTWRGRVRFSLTVLLISIFDIRVLYLLFIILGIYIICTLGFNLRKWINILPRILISSIFTALTLIGFHAFWILPSLFSKAPQLPVTYDRLSQVSFLSFSSIGHSIFLQQPHWFNNVFGRISNLMPEFILIPILIFLSPILIKKNANIAFWLVIALVGIFLSKGSQDPLPDIYLWLFGHVPFFTLFRDPVKFYFLTSLSYIVLIGFTISAIGKLKFTNKIVNLGIKIVPFLVFIYLLFLARPIYLGWMSGMISQPAYLSDYQQMGSVLEKDHRFSRVLWLPSQSPLEFSNLDHPPLEASRIVAKRPFAIGAVGNYETLNFLRESPVMDQLLEVSDIGYLAYPYLDPKRDDISFDHIRNYYTFLKQLLKKPWLSDLTAFSRVPLLKVNNVQNQFFVVPNTWWVVGSDDIYNESTRSAKLRLSNNALIFEEENANLGKRIDELQNVKIVLHNKGLIDLAASFINPSSLIFPARQLDFNPDKSGWWKREGVDLVSWKDFLKTKYGIYNQDFDLGGGWAVAEGNLQISIKNENFKKDNKLLVRAMESSRSGTLKFYQGSRLIGQINTKVENGLSNVRWFDVGNLINGDELSVISEGEINVLNTIGSLSKSEWADFENKANSYKSRGLIVDFKEENALQKSFTFSYKQISPTQYKVSIEGLDSNALLIFSENFDSLWQINGGSRALPVYSLLNGFRVDKDGEYIIEFTPQRFVNIGLIVAGITILVLICLYVLTTKRLRSKI